MTIWFVPLVPIAAAVAIGLAGRGRSRPALGMAAAASLAVTIGVAAWAAAARPSGSYDWGAGLSLRLAVDDTAAVMAVLVPAVALVVVAYAAAHEHERGLVRLVAVLVAFVGAMELLVLADDVLTLVVGWELVGFCSFVLIDHEWWVPGTPSAAGQAFVTTHIGDLALLVAAGAAVAGVGSLDFAALGGLHGGWLSLFVAAVLVAAASKSAQLPFSPWLFSAMAGPTSASALLHAATMVAAGTYVLVRLQPVLDRAEWFAPVAIGVGLATALAGGLVASLHGHAKKVLAASTSAQYGLMFVAVGAGFPAVAMAHLVTHAVLKAGLFMAAGVAIEAAATPRLDEMRLGRSLPVVAALSAVLALALAAVPPLGAAWTKEQIMSAGGEWSPWLALGVAGAGALSAWYAARFQLLAYGPGPEPGRRRLSRRPGVTELAAIGAAAAGSLGLGLVWLPAGRGVVEAITGAALPSGQGWEPVVSLGLVAMAIGSAIVALRTGRLAGDTTPGRRAAAEWLGLATVARVAVADPVLATSAALPHVDDLMDLIPRAAGTAGGRLAPALARWDTRVVDAGVRGAAGLALVAARVGANLTEPGTDAAVGGIARVVGRGGRAVRALQTGLAHHYYVILVAGCAALFALVAVLR